MSKLGYILVTWEKKLRLGWDNLGLLELKQIKLIGVQAITA